MHFNIISSRPQNRAGLFSLLFLNLLIAAVFLNTSLPLPTARAEQNVPVGGGFDSPFGMNVMGASRYRTSGTDYSVPFDSAKGANVAWTREEMGWQRIEPRAGTFDFAWTDGAIAAAQSRGLNVLGLLGYNVDRTQGRDAVVSYTMPGDLNAWGNYLRAVVNRYKGRVSYWQIWNEPQDEKFFRGASPVEYARLLGYSYDVIKAADPNAQVLAAGFVPVDNGLDWMYQMLAAPGGNKFDIITVHPYVNDPTPNRAGGSMSPEKAYWASTDLNQIHNFAARVGKPVWATEFGWNLENTEASRFNKVSAEQQANYLTRAYAMGLNSVVQKFFVYQFHDDTINLRDKYGLVGQDWRSQKPSYGAYRQMVERLSGATPQGRYSPYEGTSGQAVLYNFDSYNGPLACGNPVVNGGSWDCFASPGASLNAAYSPERTRSGGGKALKINYNFNGTARDQYITFYNSTLPATGVNPTRLGFWMLGDGTRTELRVRLNDNVGQVVEYNVGRVGPAAAGWQRYEAQLAYPLSGGPATLSYPVRRVEILLDAWPKNGNFGGTIYLDDIYVENSPPVYIYRYARNGQTIDVIWADEASATINLPTASPAATVYNRNGGSRSVAAAGGTVSLPVSDEPIYVEHVAASAPNSGPTPGGGNPSPVGNCPPGGEGGLRPLFQPTWERYDEAVVTGRARRSWIWGPTAFRFAQEAYDEAPGGCRTVLYWDKSRMEITNPAGNQTDKYFVTNGLLARELISGKIQVGNNRVIPAPQGPAQIPAAGDQANNPNAPTYAAFARVTSLDNDRPSPDRQGAEVIETLNRNGDEGSKGGLALYNVRLTNYVATTRHNTADVFWAFMNSRGPVKSGGVFTDGDAVDWIYSIGLPLSEPYWARVTVGGVEKDVLIQVFERRVLTYTPSNPAGFQVEMGNIGGHYALWRYGRAEG